MHLRAALPRDAVALSDLALRSKGHWGYDAAFMDSCREELRVRPDDCDGVRLRVAQADDHLAGFLHLTGGPDDGALEALFVAPEAMGRGVGRLLFDDACRTASSLGMVCFTLDADPHAAAFYEHLGATLIGRTPSGSVPGRTLPRYRVDLPTPPTPPTPQAPLIL